MLSASPTDVSPGNVSVSNVAHYGLGCGDVGRGVGVGDGLTAIGVGVGVAVGVAVGVGVRVAVAVAVAVAVGVGEAPPQGLTGQLKIYIEATMAPPPS